jgi:predicted O-methyltransferase YrrM
MEIGVLDGENARTMIGVAVQTVRPDEVEYYGFDFFYGSRLHQVKATLKRTGCKFQLFKGDTVDTLPPAAKTLPKMDLIFIDGGKSFAAAKSDWKHAKTLMHHGTAVFVHNYEFSGIRRMVDAINRDAYQVEILHPPDDYATAMIYRKRK